MKKFNILIILTVIFSLGIFEAFGYKPTYITKKSNKEIKSVGAGCYPPTAFKFLEFNNVRARINNGGDMWWDLAGTAKYEVPKGSGISSLFAGSVWIGGTDTNGQLRLAANKFRSEGVDFYPGPLVSDKDDPNRGNVTPDICNMYDVMYYVTRVMVSEHLAYVQSEYPTLDYPDYTRPAAIENWPAHGPADEYDRYLAPFRDIDGDGEYNPDAGDYPYYIFDAKNYNCNSVPKREADSLNSEDMPLYGDATFWWVYNDRGNVHGETGGEAIGMEFRAQAFAFATNDELNNMTFYNYQIINRSSYTLRETYFGVWTDADLGNAEDDFVGCDVQRGLGYLYNGDDNDETGDQPGYGKNPPAVGIDFFEGPYKDPSGQDDFSSYGFDNELDCMNGYMDTNGDGVKDSVAPVPNTILNGNINGLNFGDGIADNERWGMRRFLFFNNNASDYGDPNAASEYYRYLTGFWRNGKRMTYGGTGYSGGTNLEADFMFPGDSDPCNWGTGGVMPSGYEDGSWTEAGQGNSADDRRFVQSAGPFTLEPGMVNYITTGAVWARSYEGDLLASVRAVRKADDKAQALFEQCFQMIDGPDAPDLTFIPMDGKFIVHISNSPVSNNYLEQYQQEDFFISTDYENRDFTFQGYQIYQLRDANVTLDQLQDVEYARVIFQCDLKDDIGDLVNFTFNAETGGVDAVQMVEANNAGLRHTFEINTDLFSSGSQRGLINNKKYYYIGIAYSHNEFKKYNPIDGDYLDGQSKPYLGSRKSVSGELMVLEQIPHPRNMDEGGTVLNADYGTQPAVTRIEGEGGSQRYLKLAEGLEERILQGEELTEISYQEGYSPIDVQIIDPFSVQPGEYYVGLCKDSINYEEGHYVYDPPLNPNAMGWGHIKDTKWYLARMNSNGVLDTLYVSDTWISQKNEIAIDTLGISIDFEQYGIPFVASTSSMGVTMKLLNDNGYIGASLAYDNEDEPWLDFITDQEGPSFLNWIRAGEVVNAPWQDASGDKDGIYESVLGGKWAPARLTSAHTYGPRPSDALFADVSNFVTPTSVDIVFTKNRDLWTRVPVFETSDNTSNTQGQTQKMRLRAAPSVDKNGNAATTTDISNNPEDANYLGATGWGWFPGYAIDVNRGERLNMAFGEMSDQVGFNGRDMIWNPVETIVSSDGSYIMGGGHYIYVFAADQLSPEENGFVLPGYNQVELFRDQLVLDRKKTQAFMSWVSLPIIRRGYEFVSYEDMPDNDLRIELRTARPYGFLTGVDAVSEPINNNYPLYKFTLDEYVPIKNNKPMAEEALKSVNIVPNPYYAGNNYELSPLEYTVKIINLPEKCDVKIFNMAGTLVRSYSKDNSSTIIEWDLKNNYQVPIAGGLYIIHINAPGVGEKTLKWFGVLRPDDLSSF